MIAAFLVKMISTTAQVEMITARNPTQDAMVLKELIYRIQVQEMRDTQEEDLVPATQMCPRVELTATRREDHHREDHHRAEII